MRSVSIGMLCELKYGKSLRKDTRTHGSVPVYGSNGIVDYHDEALVGNQTIIVGRKGSIGEVHYVDGPSWPIDTTYFVALRNEHEVDLKWFYRILSTLRLSDLNRSAAIPGLNREDVYRIEIPLPPLDDQIRIAHVLSKVEGLIAQRKQHLQQLDDLLKSVFLEMFGDPVRNEKGWEPHSFSSLFSVTPRIGTTTPVTADGTIPVVRVGELGHYQVNFNNCKRVKLEEKEMDKCRVYKGDILLARAIASQDHLGKASLITHLEQSTAFDSHVMRIRYKAELVDSIFAYHWLKSSGGRSLFLKASGRTSVQFNVNSKQINSVKMPLPPIDLQNKFATFVEKVEGIKARYQQSLTELKSLYGAVSQKAFKGELDLSLVPLKPITANLDVQQDGDTVVATATVTDQSQAINLPDVEDMAAALVTVEGRHRLLQRWLESYVTQLKGSKFSVSNFLGAAQVRMAELHPENDFELGLAEYEQIKDWVFVALGGGRLSQVHDNPGNRVQIVAAKS